VNCEFIFVLDDFRACNTLKEAAGTNRTSREIWPILLSGSRFNHVSNAALEISLIGSSEWTRFHVFAQFVRC
jgi:hypothetical protein